MTTAYLPRSRRCWLIVLGVLVCATQPLAADEPPPLPQFAVAPIRIPETMQRVTAVEFSPDGKFLLAAHGWFERNGSIQIWEVATGRRVGRFILPSGISSVGWMQSGKQFAVSSWDTTVRVYGFPSLQQTTQFKIDRSVGRLAVSPDGAQIVTAAEGHRDADESSGRVVQIWNAKTGELVRQCDSDETLFRLGCATWSPQGKYVASGGGYYGRQVGLGRLWFADSGKEASRLEGHTGYIRAIRFFPDDLQVATSGLDGTVRIWESATGKELARFVVGSLVDGLDVSSDGRLVASGGTAGEIALWSPIEKQKVAELSKTGSAVHAVSISRSGKVLASGHADGIVRIWNASEQVLVREMPAAESDDRPGVPQAIAGLAEGRIAVIGYDTGIMLATDIGSRATTWRFQTSRGKSPNAIAVSADQKLLLVGYEDGAVRLHSASDGKAQAELKDLPAKISSVAFGAGDLLAAGDTQGRVRMWERAGKGQRTDRQDHDQPVLAIGFADKGRAIVSVAADGKAICRKTNSDETLSEARISTAPLTSVSVSGDGGTLVAFGKQLTVWNTLPLTRRNEIPILVNPRNTVTISPSGALVMVSHPLGTSMFDVNQQGDVEPVRTTNSREGGLFTLSSDNRVLLQATTGGALLAWTALPPQISPLGQIERVGNAVALATSPDGKWLVAGGDDSQATVWDLATGEIVESLPGNTGTMYAIRFSANGEFLATANLTGTVKVWRVKDWSLEGALLDPRRQVRCVAFSPDGRWLASGGHDRRLLITDTQTWDTVAEKPDQDLWVEGIAFSPDGTRLYSVTGSWDAKDQPVTSMLTAWKVTPGKDKLALEPIKKIAAHDGTTDNLVLTTDGRHVITGGADSLIKVWDAKTLDLVRSIKLPAGAHRLHLLRSDPGQIIVGDHLGGVSVWNVQTGVCLANYVGHTSHVFDVSATIDGRLLITAGEDDRIIFWSGPDRGPDDSQKKFLRNAADEKPQ